MNSFYDRAFFKFLNRNKSYTAISMAGLAISLMFVILMAVYIYQELSVDRFHADADRICLQFTGSPVESGSNIGKDGMYYSPQDALPVAYWLKERFAAIEEVCPVVSRQTQSIPLHYKDLVVNGSMAFTESNFFTFFSFPLKQGNPETVLEDEYSAVVSESFARKIFGSEDPMGKSIRITDSTWVVVKGVMADMKNSLLPEEDLMLRVERVSEFNGSIGIDQAGNAGCTLVFLKMLPGRDMNTYREEVLDLYKERYWLFRKGFSTDVKFVPLRDAYFEVEEAWLTRAGDKQFVQVLAAVALMILLFAVFNYINLTVAQSGFRAKEVAIRRLSGASRFSVMSHLVGEALFLALCSYLMGLLLALAFQPVAENLLQATLDMSLLASAGGIAAALLLVLLTGLFSGCLPAVFISSFRPVDVVKGTFTRRSKMVSGKVFMVLQNGITIGMLTAALVFSLQIRHLVKAPLGYNTLNVLDISAEGYTADESKRIIDRLLSLSSVKRVGRSLGTPFDGGNNLSGTYEDRNISMQQLFMDSTAFHILGLKILQDNNLATGEGVYLTQGAFKAMGLAEDAPAFHYYDSKIPISGVVADFQRRNILFPEDNSWFMLGIRSPEDLQYVWDILVEIQGDPATAYKETTQVVKEVTGQEAYAGFLDLKVRQSFDAQIRLSKIVALFAGVALVISVMGLVAMSMYFIRQRTKEVAIRKVFGSENGAVMALLLRSFLLYVGIGFVLAVPFCWVFLARWLETYSYHIAFNPLYILLAGLFCLLVSFLAVAWQSYRAAHADPVQGVRQE